MEVYIACPLHGSFHVGFRFYARFRDDRAKGL